MTRTYLLPWLERQSDEILNEIFYRPKTNKITKEEREQFYKQWCESSMLWRDEMYKKHY